MKLIELPEPLKSLQEDLSGITSEMESVRQKIEVLQSRLNELKHDHATLSPTVEMYRRKYGVKEPMPSSLKPNGVSENATRSNPTDVVRGRESLNFSAIGDSMKDNIFIEYLAEKGRFRKIGEAVEDLQREYEGVTRHHLRTILARLMRNDVLVQLQYGDSKRYISYGLKDFVKIVDGKVWISSPDKWPEMHSSMNEPPSFEWNSKPEPEPTPEPEESLDDWMNRTFGNN